MYYRYALFIFVLLLSCSNTQYFKNYKLNTKRYKYYKQVISTELWERNEEMQRNYSSNIDYVFFLLWRKSYVHFSRNEFLKNNQSIKCVCR